MMCNCYKCRNSALIGSTSDETEIVKRIINLDQQTYINTIKALEVFHQIPTPMWNNDVLNAYDELQSVMNRYDNRQTQIRTLADGQAKPMLEQNQSFVGYKFTRYWQGIGIGAVPLIPIAIAAIFGAIGGGLGLYYWSQSESEAQMDLIVSSQAWQTLKAAYPVETKKVEGLISSQLTKANANGLFSGTGSAVKWLTIGGLGLLTYNALKN